VGSEMCKRHRASTDPVAVAALGRRLSLPTRLQVLVQAESLFNDATSLVLFRVALAAAVAGGAIAPGHAIGEFALLAVGGTLIGVAVSGGVAAVRRRTEDPVLESVIALVTPYAAFVLAESVGASGVTAVVVAAILLGQQSANLTTAHIRLQLAAVSATVIFILESVVFSLIGLQLPTLIRSLAGTDTAWLLPSLVIAGALIATRILWVFPLAAIAQWRSGARRPSWQVPAVVTWAGARGVVPLAAALSIPLTAADGSPLPDRELVQVLATVVIVISLVVQGFTLEPLVRRAGIALEPAIGAKEDTVTRLRLAQASLDYLEHLDDVEATPPVVIDRARRNLLGRRDRIRTILDGDEQHDSLAPAYRRLRRDLLEVERAELYRLYDAGTIGDSTRRRVERILDLEDAALGDS
jgi:Na+/H+ antiporter